MLLLYGAAPDVDEAATELGMLLLPLLLPFRRFDSEEGPPEDDDEDVLDFTRRHASV